MSTAIAEKDVVTDETIHVTNRCDRCPARAQGLVLVDTAVGLLPLEFCGHHLAQHQLQLEIEGFDILPGD